MKPHNTTILYRKLKRWAPHNTTLLYRKLKRWATHNTTTLYRKLKRWGSTKQQFCFVNSKDEAPQHNNFVSYTQKIRFHNTTILFRKHKRWGPKTQQLLDILKKAGYFPDRPSQYVPCYNVKEADNNTLQTKQADCWCGSMKTEPKYTFRVS